MKNDDSEATVVVGCGTLFLLPLFIAWRSFVATKLWAWFVVTTFKSPQIDMPTAYGLLLVACMLIPHSSSESKDGSVAASIWRILGLQLFWPGIVLLLGYITKGLL